MLKKSHSREKNGFRSRDQMDGMEIKTYNAGEIRKVVRALHVEVHGLNSETLVKCISSILKRKEI